MRKAEFEEYCRKRGFDNRVTEYSVGAVQELEGILAKGGKALDSVAVDDVRAHVRSLISQRKNTQRRLLALARYFYVVGNNPAYVYLASLLGARGILPTLSRRVASIAGDSRCRFALTIPEKIQIGPATHEVKNRIFLFLMVKF